MYFNPKCIFPYKKSPHTHCVYSTEFSHFITPRVNSSLSVHCKKLVANMCNTTQEVLLSSTTLIYLKKNTEMSLSTLTVFQT